MRIQSVHGYTHVLSKEHASVSQPGTATSTLEAARVSHTSVPRAYAGTLPPGVAVSHFCGEVGSHRAQDRNPEPPSIKEEIYG